MVIAKDEGASMLVLARDVSPPEPGAAADCEAADGGSAHGSEVSSRVYVAARAGAGDVRGRGRLRCRHARFRGRHTNCAAACGGLNQQPSPWLA